jgi:putative redox protein
MDSVNVKWNGKMSFISEIDGHEIVIDAKEDVGGGNKGPRPKPLILTALGGCTGMDVASILTKMRVPFESLNVKVDGELTEEHPKHYYEIKVTYELTGKDLNLDSIRKAVDLSEERYCGVSHMLRKALKISNQIVVNGEVV